MSRKNVRFSFCDPDQQVPIQEERRKSYPKETRWSKGYTSESSSVKRKVSVTETRKDLAGASQQSITSKNEERKAFHKEKRWNDGHLPEESKTVRGETREEHSTASRNQKRRVSFSSDIRDETYADNIRGSPYPKESRWLMNFTFPPRLEKNESYPGMKRSYISGTSKQPTPTLEEEPLNNWKRRVSFSTDVPDESFFDEKPESSYPKEMRWKMGFAFPYKLGKKKHEKKEISSRSDKHDVTRIERRGSKVRFSFDESEASKPFFEKGPKSPFPKEKRWGMGYTAEINDSSTKKQLEWNEGSHLGASGTRHSADSKPLRGSVRREQSKESSLPGEQKVWDPMKWISRDKLRGSESLAIDNQLCHSSDGAVYRRPRQPSVYINVDFRGQTYSPELIEWFREFWDFVKAHPEIRPRPNAKEPQYESQTTQTKIAGLSADVNLSPAVDYSDREPWLNKGLSKVEKLRTVVPYVTSTFSPERYPWLWRKVCLKFLGLDKDLAPSSQEHVVLDDRVWADEVLEDNEEVVRNLPHIEPSEATEAFRKHIYVQDKLRETRNPTFHRQLQSVKFQ